MLQLYTANELREIHEQRIAPFIHQNPEVSIEPEETPEKPVRQGLSQLVRRLTGTA
jgi:hypothetical protein